MMVQINVDPTAAFESPQEGQRVQMGNTDNFATRSTGFRGEIGFPELAETYAEIAVLDGRIAGYHDSVQYLVNGTCGILLCCGQ